MRSKLKTWNDRLNWAIKARGVKKAQLARECGVERPSVQEWTDGTTKDPKLVPFFAACDFLKVRPRWLALGDEPIDPLPDDAPRHPPLTELLTQIAVELARRSDDDQRRVLEIVMRIPETLRPTAATERRAGGR